MLSRCSICTAKIFDAIVELADSGCEQVVVTDLAVDYTGLDDEEVRHLLLLLYYSQA